jgi:hypothetical protein
VELPRKLLKGIVFIFVGVCVLCVCVCSVCLCWGGFPCWTPGTKHLASLAVLQILVTTNLTKPFFLCRSISILLYLCRIMKACNPIQIIWSICSCEFCMLHSRQLWPNHNFLFQGVDHTKYQFIIRSHEASWCDLFFFCLQPIGQTATQGFPVSLLTASRHRICSTTGPGPDNSFPCGAGCLTTTVFSYNPLE